MIKLFIISAIAFTIGNLTWNKFGINDPRVFYIPLSLYLWASAFYIRKISFKQHPVIVYLLDYVLLLASGNVIKQIFYYSEDIKQINDYAFGALATIWLIIMLIKWAIHTNSSGRK